MNLNQKLRNLRKNKSQKIISQDIGIPYANYNKYETTNTFPDIETLVKIADYYGCSVDYLLDHKSTKQDFGYLTEEQVQAVEIIKSLNQINLIKIISYGLGLLENQ